MSKIYNPSGGYRKLYSFNFTVMVHLGTISFCKRFIPWQEDTLGKTVGQMIGASRSGKQNIIEGSERSGTSIETEIKLTDVARASLNELQGDLEDYIVQKGAIPWSIHNENYKAIMALRLADFEYCDDLLHEYWKYLLGEKRKFDPWLESSDDMVVANALILLIQRATGLLGRQMQRQEQDFLAKGGVKERMYAARIASRNSEVTAPECPECGAPMHKRNSAHGYFWGCSAWPNCKGKRQMEK